MPQEGIDLSPQPSLLTTDEILRLSHLFINEGVTKIRLTGGEPTIRKDLEAIVRNIRVNPRLRTLAITTNGLALSTGGRLDRLLTAGINAINISLDTLDPLKFPILTRREGFDRVMRTIQQCLDAGVKTKVNCVLMRGINDDEVVEFAKFTQDRDLEVRFIEYMPFDGNRWESKKMVPYMEARSRIESILGPLQRGRDDEDRVAKTYFVPGFKGRIAFISSLTDKFCGTCNRVRLTADGHMKVCLFGPQEICLRDIVRGEPSTLDLVQQLIETLPAEHVQRVLDFSPGDAGASLSSNCSADKQSEYCMDSTCNDPSLATSTFGVASPSTGPEVATHLILDRTKPSVLETLNKLRSRCFESGTGTVNYPDHVLRLVISAVLRKKQPAHAGMDVLKQVKNRPMIKIGG